jgi:putative effector of murein hydrolase LrgA (UPF0299 family)
MKKRVLAAVLWTYVTWYACNVLGAFAGVALPGALFGLAAGAIVLALPVIRAQQPGAAPVAAPTTVPAEG